MTRDELHRMVAGQHGIIPMLSDRIDESVFEAAPTLRVVANYAAGYNNIDLAAARARGIVVTNTPGVLTDATADLTWALILGVTRRVSEGERLVRSGRWTGWVPTQLLGTDLKGAVLGIVGLGRIGRAVASRANAFGMRVTFTARRPPSDIDADWRYASLPELLSTADVVSLHVPLTEQTRHLIGATELAMMKPTAYLVNTARGPVIDESALVDALHNSRIAGVGLDVYEEEPRVHPGLLTAERTLLLPHLGSATTETRERMAMMAIDNLLAALEGRQPPNPVRE